jgi:hypothetical protein
VGVKRYADQRNIPTSFPQEEAFAAFAKTLKKLSPRTTDVSWTERTARLFQRGGENGYFMTFEGEMNHI